MSFPRYYGVETSLLRAIRAALVKDIAKSQTHLQRLNRTIAGRRRGHPRDTQPKGAYSFKFKEENGYIVMEPGEWGQT